MCSSDLRVARRDEAVVGTDRPEHGHGDEDGDNEQKRQHPHALHGQGRGVEALESTAVPAYVPHAFSQAPAVADRRDLPRQRRRCRACRGSARAPNPPATVARRRLRDGGASVTMASMAASSAGTAISEAAKGEPPFVDPVSKVQRLQRSRLHGRFQRESRVQRRWEELKGMAVAMQHQEQQEQKQLAG